MKWLVDFVKRETWWRHYYQRITLLDKVAWRGKCLVCSAATGELRCDISKERKCPCKWNQCLKLK